MSSYKEIFDKQNLIGKKGEYLVINYLLAHGYQVTDISDEYKLHTDLLLTRENGTTFMVEVKYDTRMESTGNMFLETKIEYVDGNREVPGWIHQTKADYIFYINAHTGQTFIFTMNKLYPLIQHNAIAAPVKECVDKVGGMDYKYVSGLCVAPNSNKLKPALFGVIQDIRV